MATIRRACYAVLRVFFLTKLCVFLFYFDFLNVLGRRGVIREGVSRVQVHVRMNVAYVGYASWA